MLKKISYSALSIISGLVLITLITEGIEILTINLFSEKSLSELMNSPDEYFEARNQPLVIVLKILYNTIAAFIGGYVCSLIARMKPLLHNFILAVMQIAGFIYGMTISKYSNMTPIWLWLILMVLTTIGIILPGYLKENKSKY